MNIPSIHKELTALLGRDAVFTAPEYRIAYSYDATAQEYLPDIVVFPRRAEDVQGVLRLAAERRIPVVPRGAGVGYSGGALAVQGGILLAFTRMNRIVAIDETNYLAVVEPGVVTQELQQAVERRGLFYPPDPASLKTSTIGGNVAENAGGPRCFKYGVTGNYVLALEAYLMNGERIRVGAHTIKNVAGYDVKSLLVGSEGTLAVITSITLRLIPKPERAVLFKVDFPAMERAAAFIHTVIRHNLQPAVLEFIDHTSLAAVSRYLGREHDPRCRASILLELDGREAEVQEKRRRLQELIAAAEPVGCAEAVEPAAQEELWKVRRTISPAIATLKPKKINEDIAVPIGRIPEAVERLSAIGRECDIEIILFGHFGDGNIHTNLMVDPTDAEEMARAARALDKIFSYVISVSGTISGEHGIGLSKKPFMHYQFRPAEIDLFRAVKQAFDPLNLLNPNKIF